MAWEMECRTAGVDCPFMIRDENKNELANLAQQHIKNTHQKSMSKEEILSTTRQV